MRRSEGLGLALVALAPLALECEDAVRGKARTDLDASPDASLDASAEADAAEEIDAADALVSEERLPSYCDIVKPEPSFCDDFEGPFKANWDNINRVPDAGEGGGGKLLLDGNLSLSPPNSVRMQTPPLVSSGEAAWASLVRSWHDPPTDMTFEGEFRIDTEYMPDGGTKLIPILTLHFVDVGFIFVYRTHVGPAVSISEQGSPPGPVILLTRPFPVGEWTTVSLIVKNRPIDEAGPNGEILVRIDELNAALAAFPASFQNAKEVEFIYGTIVTGVIGEFRMNVDNIRVYDRSDL